MRNNVIDVTSLFLQALSLEILFKDFNNSDLMQELRLQDENYFKTLIKNQEEILTLLRKENADGKRSN